jgi:hypothetical protein
MPSTQLTRGPHRRRIQVIDWKIEGDDRLEGVQLQLPGLDRHRDGQVGAATEKATWLTTSGITGLTLPGMIDDPACARAG